MTEIKKSWILDVVRGAFWPIFATNMVSGIELNKASVAVAREAYGLHIANELAELEGQRFDVIVLIEVIEHVSNVDEIMKIVDSLLVPGGKIVVTTDAIDNPVSQYFPAWAPHFTGPSHISLFTVTALSRLLTRFGFEIEKASFTHTQELFGDFFASPFYSLDFASPTSIDDLDDRIYVPTRFGRWLGLRSTRELPALFRLIRKVDGMAGRLLKYVFKSRFCAHQFVLARKVEK